MRIALKIAGHFLRIATDLEKDNSNLLTECGPEIKNTLCYKMNELKIQIALLKYNIFKQLIKKQ